MKGRIKTAILPFLVIVFKIAFFFRHKNEVVM